MTSLRVAGTLARMLPVANRTRSATGAPTGTERAGLPLPGPIAVTKAGGMRVLIVEDDAAIADSLRDGLTRHGFDVEIRDRGAEAIEAGASADVVLLDLGLPDVDGVDVCRELRARSDVAIIMVTARDDELDRVVGLEVGADDYVVKPFGLRELIARIRAVSRRSARSAEQHADDTLRLGRLVVDQRARRATVDGTEVELTPKEFDLLATLAAEPGIVLRREQLMERVWDMNWFGSTKTLDVHVASLRRKLGDPRWIETVRGVGFRAAPVE